MYEELLSRIVVDKTDIAALQKYVVRQITTASDEFSVISSKEALSKLLLLNFPTSLWAYLYKAETIKSLALDKDVHFFEDFLFNFEVLKSVEWVSLVNKDYYCYRFHDASTNSQGVTLKRLTCLNIVDKIRSYIDSDVGLDYLRSDVVFTQAHFIVGVLTPLNFNNFKYSEEYVSVVMSALDDSLKIVVLSKIVPFKY